MSEETLRALSNELVRLGRRRDMSGPTTTLDASAFKILWLLVEHGPHTLRGLAQGLQLDQSTINRQVHGAIAQDYVERYDDPDSTAMLVRATAAGETAYRSDAAIRMDGLRSIVAAMGDDSAESLAAGLASFNDAVDEAVEASQRARA